MYQQIPLSEESKQYVTMNTHKGLFWCNWLPFGVQSTPAIIIQRAMESLLQDIPGTGVYMDNILVTDKNEKEHLQNLDAILTCLENEGLTLKKPKCKFVLLIDVWRPFTVMMWPRYSINSIKQRLF